jgi:hypothetical protein
MISVIGIDPGGTTGVALLQMRPGADGTPRYCCPKAFQVGSRRAGKGEKSEDTVERLESEFGLLFASSRYSSSRHVMFAVEKFVVGPRSGRVGTPQASEVARKVIGQLWTLAHDLNAGIVERTASQVKLWATDARLRRAAGAQAVRADPGTGFVPNGLESSLYDATARLPHARDAARHALFAAVQDVHWPDPLSRAYWEPLDALTSRND